MAGVGVLVTTLGVGVLVASTMLTGVAVLVPVLSASSVAWAARVAATKTLSAVGVAVTTQRVAVAVGGSSVAVAVGAGVVGVAVGGAGVSVGAFVPVGSRVAVMVTVSVNRALTVVVTTAVACPWARAGALRVVSSAEECVASQSPNPNSMPKSKKVVGCRCIDEYPFSGR